MQASDFVSCLKKHGIDAFYGVPDSLLKNFCAYIADHVGGKHHIIAANEGNAVALAAGHYLATARPAVVYMQNSGQGNCVNPLLSLTDEAVYSIPVLLLIGWRGEPGHKDEPQHKKQGVKTLGLLDTMDIPYAVLSNEITEAEKQVENAFLYMSEHKRAYALVVRKNTFDSYQLKHKKSNLSDLSRENAIATTLKYLKEDDIIVSTTGHISREVYELREKEGESHQADFLTVGAMGHTSSIALGIAMNKPERRVVCLDGDGSFLMHMGATSIIGNSQATNFRHIILNNGAHDSVGGQPTVADKIDITAVTKASGYQSVTSVSSEEELSDILPEFIEKKGPSLLEIKVSCGARADLGRPKESPQHNKNIFMNFVQAPKTWMYPGAIQKLKEIIAANHWKNILLFTTKGRYRHICGKQVTLFQDCNVTVYSEIAPNPTAESVNHSISLLKDNYDAIVAIGGGSVIDHAKVYRASRDNGEDIKALLKRKGESILRRTPLIAVPTTAGTGSETTCFAVIYAEGKKYSLDAAAVMPDYAIVDSELLAQAPVYIKASCAMDAFAQAIEGFWAQSATEESDSYAIKAIKLCKEHIIPFVHADEPHAACNMAIAAHYAGKCINITRTTAAHALSYKISQMYGLPHGHAVALSLPGLADLHSKAQVDSVLFQKIQKLRSLLGLNSESFTDYFYHLYKKIGLEYQLSLLHINDIDTIVKEVNVSRLANNPLPLTSTDLKSLFCLK